ncbi:type I 3-dehydroquinate dehydratase [Halalkalibacter okhensis]|uniref:3-dehydroquinate dehydratase n=1 Tax=Halalkalibacter okhensis TaxID=333138 RepID=A0A0B0IJC9_9BACI|nr:type I 3-dehydroquinate dehydratase [Halalkalibacter okhensis]KHF40179.1 3-dehydroquinate dehydratase [Halalkalibacter okhensis]
MSNTVKVKGVTIGEGMPKICVPMVGKTLSDLLEEAAYLNTLDVDVVEWRVDFFEDVLELEKVKEALNQLHTILMRHPLVFTFRSAKEGGEREVSSEFYLSLNREVAKTGLVDIVDVELFSDADVVKTIVEEAHQQGVFVIISNHDFDQTPSKEEIVSRLKKAQELGGDLPKIAVMPRDTKDVLTLLEATNTMKEQYATKPIITMSMAGEGVISRLAGEVFGSALTFGAAKQASAPGQIAVADLRYVLNLLHKGL